MADELELTQRLLDSEERYRALALATFEGILIHRDGVIVEANEELARIIGYPRDRLVDAPLADFLSDDARHTVALRLSDPDADKRYEVTGTRPDGERWFAEVRSREITYRGRPARVAVVRDITGQKRIEESLRGSERELRAILANMQDTYYRTDRTGRIVIASPSCRDLLRYEADELVGTALADLYVFPEDRERFLATLADGGGRIRQYRTLLRRKDGRHIWVSTNAQYCYDAQGEVAGVEETTRDITRLIESEERLQMAVKEAEAASRAKSEFLAMMSHEIRTPMNGILTMAQMLEGTRLDAEQGGYLSAINSSGRLLHTLLNDVLDLSRIEAGKLQMQCNDFDLTQTLKNLCLLVEPLATGKGLSFRLRQQGLDAPVRLRGDEVRLQQILLNLLSNAVKFTQEGFVELTVEARAGARECALVFSVADSGIGISPAKQQRLFRAFEIGDATITRRFGGTGLGLAITRELVSAMGGSIGLTSQSGRGSTFEVRLSLDLAGRATPVEEPAPGYGAQHFEFLLVDDDAINRTAMSALLRRDGHKVTLANDGFHALDILARHQFDYVLIDVHMPGIDGIETVRRYRMCGGERAANAKVIALTADTRRETISRCGEVGIRHTLPKPLVKRDLYQAIGAPGARPV
jgi:PAS domain S-box-containing protein